MNEREAFIEGIAAHPGEDTPRLAFADWLQENGEAARAAFVRLACELARRPIRWDDPDRDRLVGLLSRHLPAWFGDLFAAVGMPRPNPPRGRTPPWGRWRHPPYALGHVYGPSDGASVYGRPDEPNPAKDGLIVRFAGKDEDPPVPRPAWLVSYLGLDRGFVTHLHVVPADDTVRGALAAAFRLEPVHELTVELDPEPAHWLAQSAPCLRRVTALHVRLADAGGPLPDYFGAVGAVFDDANLAGVRDLTFEGADPRPLHERDEDEWGQRFVPPGVVERVLQSPVANAAGRLRLHVGREGTLAFATGGALTNLRALEFGRDSFGPADRFALSQYRDRLERLSFDEYAFDAAPLLAGRPWERLERLTLPGNAVGAREWEVLARPDMFPAIARLGLAGWATASEPAVAALVDAFRGGGFARLTHLDLTGFPLSGEGALAVAEAVAPTAVRELDLTSSYGVSEETAARLRELLGGRVRVPPADDAIPF